MIYIENIRNKEVRWFILTQNSIENEQNSGNTFENSWHGKEIIFKALWQLMIKENIIILDIKISCR